MEPSELIKLAYSQKMDWSTMDGRIDAYDFNEKSLTIEKENGLKHEFNLNENAEKQLINRMRIGGTLKDFQSNTKWLRDENIIQSSIDSRINAMDNNKRLAKTRVIFDITDQQAKAVLTNKYTGFEETMNYDILEVILKRFPNKLIAKDSYIDDTHMYITIGNISQKLIGKNFISSDLAKGHGGEVIGFGIQFWNSQTGNSTLGMAEHEYRIACENGMLSRDVLNVMRQVHIYKEMIKRLMADIDTTLAKSDETAKLFQRAMQKPALITNIEKFPTILNMVKIPKRHHNGILQAHLDEPLGVDEKGGINPWGVYNATTRYNTHIYPKSKNFNRLESQELMSLAYPILGL